LLLRCSLTCMYHSKQYSVLTLPRQSIGRIILPRRHLRVTKKWRDNTAGINFNKRHRIPHWNVSVKSGVLTCSLCSQIRKLKDIQHSGLNLNSS
jgi:hypothetical protein